MVDLARRAWAIAQRLRQQVGHLLAAVHGDAVGPGLAAPVASRRLLEICVLGAHVDDDAIAVEHDGDVAGGVDQSLGLGGVEVARKQWRVGHGGLGRLAHVSRACGDVLLGLWKLRCGWPTGFIGLRPLAGDQVAVSGYRESAPLKA